MRRLGFMLAAIGFAIVLAVAVLAGLRRARPSRTIGFATGQQGGTFLPLGRTLAHGFEQDVKGLHIEVLESPGGDGSLAMLSKHQVDLALISNHVHGQSDVRLVAPLYQETLQIVARKDAHVASLADLPGKRISVGAGGSGTEAVTDAVLHHFGIADDAYERHTMAPQDAVAALEAARLDVVFLVAGMRTPAVDELLARPDMELLSLGDPSRVGSALEGIRLDAPFFEVTAIPEHAYGAQPEQPVGTISVWALLVVSESLDDDTVYVMTESLFSNKVALADEQRLLSHLTEKFDPAVSPYPVHPGADRYYRRAEPSFLEEYTDQIGLALTVAAILWSGITSLRAWRRARNRDRVEARLERARALAAPIDEETDAAAAERTRGELVRARDEALRELAHERLDANPAFSVLHDYLTARIEEAERKATRLRSAAAASG